MTETDIQIDVGPLVQIVLPEGEQTFPFSDLAFETDDPATISDPDLVLRVARHLDREVADFADLMVSRPRTGNILISEKPVFGRLTLEEYRILWRGNAKYHWEKCRRDWERTRFYWREGWHEAVHALKCLWWAAKPKWLVPGYKVKPRNG